MPPEVTIYRRTTISLGSTVVEEIFMVATGGVYDVVTEEMTGLER